MTQRQNKSDALLKLKESLDSVGTKLNGLTWQRIDTAMKEYASQFQPRWIKIESEADLPKDEGLYLVWWEGHMLISKYNSKFKIWLVVDDDDFIGILPQYWTYLPEPPKED